MGGLCPKEKNAAPNILKIASLNYSGILKSAFEFYSPETSAE